MSLSGITLSPGEKKDKQERARMQGSRAEDWMTEIKVLQNEEGTCSGSRELIEQKMVRDRME